MVKISLQLPLRKQHDVFTNLMESLVNTTANPKKIEMLVVVDDDDIDTIAFIKECSINYSFNIRLLITKRSDFFIRDYHNFAERQMLGRWIININADSYFRTKNWDIIINKRMSDAALKFGDDIIYGIITDNLLEKVDVDFSCWCLCSKEYVDLMGGVADGRIAMWGADVAIGLVFDLVDNGNRKIHIPEVSIDHMSHHVYKEIPESEHIKRFHNITSRLPSFLTDEQIIESANKINEYIRNKTR